MFGLASGFYQNYLKPPEVQILIVGLDGAGKTSLLERLKVTDFNTSERKPYSHISRRVILERVKHHHQQQNGNSNHSSPPPDTNQSTPNSDDQNGHTTTQEQKNITPIKDPKEIKVEKKNNKIIPLLRCPAPSMYHNNVEEDENDVYEIPIKHSIDDNDPKQNSQSHIHSTDHTSHSTVKSDSLKVTQSDANIHLEYDLLNGKNMLPLHLIRPTLGMNLAKLDIRGGKVKFMDLGGSLKMRSLWERYYGDIHGIAFIIDVSSISSLSKLMEARAFYRCMRDDDMLQDHGVPVLIFGNKLDEQEEYYKSSSKKDDSDDAASPSIQSDENSCDSVGSNISRGNLGKMSLLRIAELFLSPPRGCLSSNASRMNNSEIEKVTEEPDFVDDKTALFGGSAKTGEGIRAAFEWLVVMAQEHCRAQQQ